MADDTLAAERRLAGRLAAAGPTAKEVVRDAEAGPRVDGPIVAVAGEQASAGRVALESGRGEQAIRAALGLRDLADQRAV